ncbi:hypothetical protein Tco_0318830 [Tanacetum coccineum]
MKSREFNVRIRGNEPTEMELVWNITHKDTYPILLSFTHCGNKSILRVLRIILVILPEHPSETIVFHNEDGNPARANIKQALGYLKDGDGDGNSQPHKGVKASANSDVMYSFTSAQDGDPLQDDVRLCLGNDLKKAQDHSQRQACDCADTMADVNANALAEQAPAMAPPTRTDDQILPRIRWVPLWRELTTIINLCLTGNTLAFKRPRAPVLQILWGIVNRAHIDYAERMWEEFTQSIHSFIEDKKNLALHIQGKKKSNPLVILSVMFTKLIIHHLQSKHKFHSRPDSPLHLPYEEYVLGYLKLSAKGTKWEYLDKVAKHQRYLAGEKVSDPDSPVPKPPKATKPKATMQSKPQPPKPTPATTEPSKKDQSVPDKEPVYGDEEADTQRVIEESLKEVHNAYHGLLPPVVIREPDSGKFQPLPDVQGKGKERVADEQVALDLLTLQTPKKKSPAEQYIFQRCSSAPTEPSGHDESSSLYVELGLIDSETEFDEEVPGNDDGDEGQDGLNPSIQDEGQAGSNPGDAAVSQPQSSHAVHDGPNCEHMDFEVTNTSIQQNPEQMDEEFTTTDYPNVQENLKLPTKDQEDEPEKTNTESEVQSMVTVPIHKDTSSVPLMTTLVIDLIVSQLVSTTVQAPLPTSTTTITAITTTTSLLPPPTQP